MKNNIISADKLDRTIIEYDVILTSNFSKDEAEKLEKQLFEKGEISYAATNSNTDQSFFGKLVKMVKTKDKYLLYIKLDTE